MAKNQKETVELTLSDFAENFFYLRGAQFSLDEYPHMRNIYNSTAQDVVMKFSRQCVVDDQVVRLANGLPKKAVDLKEGDPVIGFNTKTLKNEVTSIKNVWDNGRVPCYEIKTRMGHSCKVTHNHPIWTLRGWKDAEKFKVGDDIAISWNDSCALEDKKTIPDWKVTAMAHLLAEGSLTGPRGINYSNMNDDNVSELSKALKNLNNQIELKPTSSPQVERPGQYRINGLGSGTSNPVIDWLKEEGVYGHNSETKFHPDWIYLLTKEQIIEYLRVWWNTDGYVSYHSNNNVYINIGLISRDLIIGLKYLLLKLGIATRIYYDVPKVYDGTDKKVWVLSILGSKSKKIFLDLIPSYKINKDYQFLEGNGKPFFYDYKYIYDEVLKETRLEHKIYRRKNNVSIPTLRKFYKSTGNERIKDLLEADQYFDEVTEVNYLGELSSTNIETKKTKNFYIDGIAVSNTSKSTTLANIVLGRALMEPNINQLYVSPAVAQTQEWARDKLEPVIKNSPLIQNHYIDSNLVQNVYKKEFKNGSVINLRYALLNADRIRGISADYNYFDECLTDDMEVLTLNGWKNVSKINTSDQLATVNKQHQLEYQVPERIVDRQYEGDIFKFEQRGFLVKTTPGHNMYVQKKDSEDWEFIKAEEIKDSTVTFLSNPQPASTPSSEKYLKYIAKDFFTVLGWVFSRGEISKEDGKLHLLFKENRFFPKLKKALDNLKISYWHKPGTNQGRQIYVITDEDFLEYFYSLEGKFPRDLYTKYNDYIDDFCYSFFQNSSYRTMDKDLADELQALLLVGGRTAGFSQRQNRVDTTDYFVKPLKRSIKIFNNYDNPDSPNKPTTEYYNGRVYCATVPNGTLITRHKDVRGTAIVGNCQDLKKDVITVIQETMSRSLIKKSVYAGTPKRTKGTLADLWFKSTQYEYVIKCDHCNHWNILGPENIARTGLVCSKCGEKLDLRVAKGEWVSTFDNPNKIPDMEGYRVCLLHFAHSPWVDWEKDVIYKMENTSTALFYNETLGLEYDSGSIPITKDELMAACREDYEMSPTPQKGYRTRPSIMGIDYGPVNSENSYTVISVLQVIDNKLQVAYAKRFVGKESDYSFIHEEVPKIFKDWNCTILAADYGMGEAPNSEFRKRLGVEKVLAFQHHGSQKEPIKFNGKMRAYTMNKNYIMNKYFEMLKGGKLRLPRWEDISDLATDARNVIIEYDEDRNTQKFTNVGPDDFVHSSLFASVAAIMLFDLGEILQ